MGHETAADIKIYCYKDPNHSSLEMVAHDGGILTYSYTIECRAQPTGHSAYWRMTEWAKDKLKLELEPLNEELARTLIEKLDEDKELEQFLDLTKRSSLFWRRITKETFSSEIDPLRFSELWRVSLKDLLTSLASDKWHHDRICDYLESSGQPPKRLPQKIQEAIEATFNATKDVPTLSKLHDQLRRASHLLRTLPHDDDRFVRFECLESYIEKNMISWAIQFLTEKKIKQIVKYTTDLQNLSELYSQLKVIDHLLKNLLQEDGRAGPLKFVKDCVSENAARRAIEFLTSCEQDQKTLREFLGSAEKPPQELPEAVCNAIANMMTGLTDSSAVPGFEIPLTSTLDFLKRVLSDDQRQARIRLVDGYWGVLTSKKNLELDDDKPLVNKADKKNGRGDAAHKNSKLDGEQKKDSKEEINPYGKEKNPYDNKERHELPTVGSAGHEDGIDRIVMTGPILFSLCQSPPSRDFRDQVVCIDVYGSQRTGQTQQPGPWPRAARIRNVNQACEAKNDSDCVRYSDSGVVIDRSGIQIQAHDRALIARAFLLAKVAHARQKLNEQLARHDFWSRLSQSCSDEVKQHSSTIHFDQMTAMFWELKSEH